METDDAALFLQAKALAVAQENDPPFCICVEGGPPGPPRRASGSFVLFPDAPRLNPSQNPVRHGSAKKSMVS
jgi:hypothetical protein